jgi:hypothetical protein
MKLVISTLYKRKKTNLSRAIESEGARLQEALASKGARQPTPTSSSTTPAYPKSLLQHQSSQFKVIDTLFLPFEI